jgi:hypothetical protein
MYFIPAGEFTMEVMILVTLGHVRQVISLEASILINLNHDEMYDACVYAIECRKPQRLGTAHEILTTPTPSMLIIRDLSDWKMAKAYCEWRGARLPTEQNGKKPHAEQMSAFTLGE